MVKKFLKFLKVLIIIAVIILGIFLYLMHRFPNGGELLYSTSSPAGEYTIDVFFHHNSLSVDGVRCRVHDTDGIMSRDIYWCFPKENVKIEWISETEVMIDGVIVNIRSDRYDCRWD